jgi:prepilin-type N-terminal cleavage/methylation domain-containing protein
MARVDRPRRTGPPGVTLVEMMVVLTVIAVILGIGVAFLSQGQKDYALRAGMEQFVSLIRFTRSSAITERSAAFITFNAEKGFAQCVTRRTLGLWHFEDMSTGGSSTGAFGRNAVVTGAVLAKGKYGNGLDFSDGGMADCGTFEALDPGDGLMLDVWIMPVENVAQTVLRKGEMIALEIGKSGKLTATLGDARVTSDDPLPLRRWSWVEISLSENVLHLKVDGVEVADPVEVSRMDNSAESLVVAPGATPFTGVVDELRVAGLFPSEKHPLPETITIDRSVEIYFDARGGLDPMKHDKPVSFEVRAPGQTRTIKVGMMGSVEME